MAEQMVRAEDHDNMSRSFAGMVPDEYRDTAQFLNIVQWNIEWFGAAKSKDKDKRRIEVVTDILEAFNADLFVFQEVAGPSKDGRYPGVFDPIAEELTSRGAGDYVVFYTEAGGEQRVAMMWDRDFLRAKTDVTDLFARGIHKTQDGKDAFAGRTPLHGWFEARVGEAGRFDFQALGVHLKAMEEGAPQREHSAKVLADWISATRAEIDADILVVGDWNASPTAREWETIRNLPGVSFDDINDESDFSYLWLANSTNKYVSRIDLTALSLASETEPPARVANVVKWTSIQEALARASGLRDAQVRAVLKEVKETVSDHLPTITQFYFKPVA